MSRINTNVSSLVAQKTLARSNADLQTALTRLSTGLRINVGKDDPAGLIASENLRRDITSVGKAISNTERANQLIATADSALGQVSSLLNDIRGLVTEAANSGVLSDEQIAANQLQVDSSLEAIDRIAQVTTFQGRRVLDGSLDFLTTGGSGYSTVADLQVQQANLGSAGQVNVNVTIATAATQAQITNAAFTGTATAATGTITFAAEAVLNGFTDAAAQVSLTAATPGASLAGVTVSFNAVNGLGVGNEVATYDSGTNTLVINIDDTTATTAANVAAAITTEGTFTAAATGAGAIDGADVGDIAVTAVTAADNIDLTAAATGTPFSGVTVSLATQTGLGATPTVAYDSATKTLTITVDDAATTTLAAIANAITTEGTFTATANANGDGNVDGANTADTTATTTTAGGVDGASLADSLVVKVGGKSGSEVFSFEAGATLGQIIAAVNLVSDATGVTATNNGGTLELESTLYGRKAFVDVEVISEGTNGTFASNLSTNRSAGKDVKATVNGITANGDGNKLSINTSSLDLSVTVTAGSSTNVNFTIDGGGALFQLGPDVVSNQQARIGIESLNSANLGGVTGRLFELRSGGAHDLKTDSTGAAKIVDEVITKVTELRGRLGAFQRTTLDTNIASLGDTLANLTQAESSIRDADFAAESAKLTRAQILVQSGTSVLAIANQNPQNVLALLR